MGSTELFKLIYFLSTFLKAVLPTNLVAKSRIQENILETLKPRIELGFAEYEVSTLSNVLCGPPMNRFHVVVKMFN